MLLAALVFFFLLFSSIWKRKQLRASTERRRIKPDRPNPGDDALNFESSSHMGISSAISAQLHAVIELVESGKSSTQNKKETTTIKIVNKVPPVCPSRHFGHAVAVIVAHNFNSWTLMNRGTACAAVCIERFLAVTFTRPVRRFISLRSTECECGHV